MLHHIIALQRGHRNEVNVRKIQARDEPIILVLNFFVALLRPIDEIHFIDRDNDMLDPKQRADETVPLGLLDDPVACINQNHSEVTIRRASRHIAGVLLVTGAVGDNKFTLVGRKVAISHINRDPLLALGLEAVGQQRWIKTFIGRAVHLRVFGHFFELILIDHMTVVQQPPDQR